MTMYQTSHATDNEDYMCQKNEGGRGYASIKYSVEALILRLEGYMKKNKERQIIQQVITSTT